MLIGGMKCAKAHWLSEKRARWEGPREGGKEGGKKGPSEQRDLDRCEMKSAIISR